VSRIRLYIDEDSMSHALTRALRARRVDVVTAWEAGMIERTDREHLFYASVHDYVLYSFNVGDFFALHTALVRENRSHSGIILARQQHYSVGEQLRRVLKLIAGRSAEDMRNRVEFLSSWG
jgi:hypothetical protein